MAVSVREHEIAFVRHRNRLMASVCLSVGRGKARFLTAERETVNVPTENVLLATGQETSDAREAATWWDRASGQAGDLDLKEVWELVREEGEIWKAADLAGFYFGDDVTHERLAAVLVHLEQSPYFEVEDEGYRPCTEAEVARQREAAERERERAMERELFQRWFRTGEETDEVSPFLPAWADRLKDYVLYPEASPHARWVARISDAQADPRRAFNRLADLGVWDPDEFLDLIRHDIPVEFPRTVSDAADALVLEPLLEDPRRRDLTELSVFTIDDAFTTDVDDGVSVTVGEDGGCRVGVHITDVSSLIPADTTLDNEALNRISSLYFPECKIPMLPPNISEELGSLRPGVTRMALSLLFDVTPQGEVGRAEIVPSMIRCKEKLAYEQVDAILEDTSHPLHFRLSTLSHVAQCHLEGRLERGAVDVDRTELKIRVTPEGEIEVSIRGRESRSNVMVSEAMVMANVAVARFCREHGIPVVYRTQQPADLSDLGEVENDVLRRRRVLRRMRPAEMSPEPDLHGGLGVDLYCQASSPLRRYADLAVQRQIVSHLLGDPLPYDGAAIQSLLYQAEERMREISRLERRRERYWLTKYLTRLEGEQFEGVVIDARERSMNVEVLAYGLAVDVRTVRPVEPGGTVTLRLGRCDPWADTITFAQVE